MNEYKQKLFGDNVTQDCAFFIDDKIQIYDISVCVQLYIYGSHARNGCTKLYGSQAMWKAINFDNLCAESIEQLSSEPWQEKHCQNLIDRDLRHDFILFCHILYHGLKRAKTCIKSSMAASYKQCFFWWLQGHTLTSFNELPLMPISKFRNDIGVIQGVI